MTYALYLMTLSSMLTVSLWAYPSHDTWAWASGEILAASRVRVCVCLLSVESVRGFPSSCLTCDAAFRMSLSAGCAVDGYRMKFDSCGFGSVFVPLALGILSFLDPVFRDLVAHEQPG